MAPSERRRKSRRKAIWWTAGATVVALLVALGITASLGALPFASADSPSPVPTRTVETPTPTPTPPPPPPAPVSPATATCDTNVTTVVVAHYDDDLLFANPAVIQALRAGDCVHTIFLTAGDAGRGLDYAMGRENGIYRAYNVMRGTPGMTWTAREYTLLSGVHATELAPDDDPRLTVTLLRLPDGNLDSSGFSATGYESLPQLYHGDIGEIRQIDTGAPLTLDSLTATIQELITAYGTDRLITLVPEESGWSQDDHDDHSAVGSIVRASWQGMGFDAQNVLYAVGYHTTQLERNVFPPDLDLKIDSFMVYAQQDPVSYCDTRDGCLGLHMFGASLERQYLLTEQEILP